MRRLIALVAVAAIATMVPAFGAGGSKLTTTLSGAEEVDAAGNPNQGDPDGSGFASLRLNQGQEEICYRLTWQNIEHPHAAHIHRAPAGVNGPVVVPLFGPPSSFPVSNEGCVPASRALVKEIRKNPSAFYVNVHNEPYPGGALRGQLGD
jgi:hypothetical protein